MKPLTDMTAEELLDEFSQDSDCSTEHGGQIKAELLRRLQPATREIESHEQLQHARHAGLAKLKGACAYAAGFPITAEHGYADSHAEAWKYGWEYARDFMAATDVRALSPREPDTTARPKCPKCGSDRLGIRESIPEGCQNVIGCPQCGQQWQTSGLSELAQFFTSKAEGWVSVKERLPEMDGRKLQTWRTGMLADEDGWNWDTASGQSLWATFRDHGFGITHWRELPAPPKGG